MPQVPGVMNKKLQKEIFCNYQAGKITRKVKYDYSIMYNPATVSYTIIRKMKTGGEWEEYLPLAKSIK